MTLRKRSICLATAILMAGALLWETPLITPLTVSAEDIGESAFVTGNSSLNILNGGVLTEDGKDISGYIDTEDYEGINVFGDHIYYIADSSAIKLIDTSDGHATTLYEGNDLHELYVVNDEDLYFLENGNAYEIEGGAQIGTASGSETGSPVRLTTSGDLVGWIPTAYGNIYARGTLLDWSVFAENKLIASGVYQYYTQEDYLVYTVDDNQYQLSLEDAFETGKKETESYDIEETVEAEDLFPDEDEALECEECEKNGQTFDEDYYFETSALEFGDEDEDPGTHSAYDTGLSERQQTIVDRARSQIETSWTPLSDVTGWKYLSSCTYKKGTTYYGVPYGQPYTGVGYYVLFDKTLAQFVSATKNSSSQFYTVHGYNNSPAYSNDCSAFVSYAWGLTRHTTSTLPNCATKQESNIYAMQVGDALDKPGSHVLLIEDMEYDDNGYIVSVTTLEQTTPITKRKVYAKNPTGTQYALDKLYSSYLNAGYYIYRLNGVADNVVDSPYKPVEESYDTPTLKSVANSKKGVTFTWNAVSGAKNYRVYRKTGSGSYSKLADTTGTSYVDTTAVSGTQYTYTVRCLNSAGTSTASSYNTTGLTIRCVGYIYPSLKNVQTGIQVSWTKVTGAQGYYVYRKTSSTSYKAIKTISGNTTVSYLDTTAANGTAYAYAVRAYYGTTRGAYTGRVGMRFSTPSISSVKNAAAGSMTLTWGKNSKASGYQIQYSTSSTFASGNKALYVTSPSTVSKKITGLTVGKKYYVRVRAYGYYKNTKYNSQWSTVKSVTISK